MLYLELLEKEKSIISEENENRLKTAVFDP